MSSSTTIQVLEDAAAVAAATAELLIQTALAAVEERGAFHLCATGGSTPAALYAALREPSRAARMPWSKTVIWFGDDRYVLRTDPRSNLASLDAVLLAPSDDGAASPLRNDQVHPWPTGLATADEVVAAYLQEIRVASIPASPSGHPTFDLVMIGIGGDGHCLSVFPGSPLALPGAPIAAGVPAPTHIEPHVARLSFSVGLLAAARSVCAVVVGDGKSAMLARILEGEGSISELPARAAVLPATTWILDRAAATELKRATN